MASSILSSILSVCIHGSTLYLTLCIGLLILLASLINAVAMKATGSTSFPQSLRASVMQYYDSFTSDSLALQNALLMSALKPALRDGYKYKNIQTILSGRDRVINSIKVTRSVGDSGKKRRTLFILHGYGSGLAFFFKVFPALLDHGEYEVHAPDWLGMGDSSRPEFRVPRHLGREEARLWVEDWFIDSLEEYRDKQGLNQVTIIAHSFGAYLAVRYAQKYANRVDQLILISPVAVNRNPYADSFVEEVKNPPKSAIPATYEPRKEVPPTINSQNNTTKRENPLPRFIVALWEAHWTPFDFIRMAGPLGPKLCSSWSLNLPMPDETYPSAAETRLLVHRYAYSIFAAPASSERALSYILVAGGHARSPLEDSLSCRVPVCLIYGKNDWMSSEAGHRAAKKCNDNDGQCNVYILSRGGHLSYLEAFPELMDKIYTELDRL